MSSASKHCKCQFLLYCPEGQMGIVHSGHYEPWLLAASSPNIFLCQEIALHWIPPQPEGRQTLDRNLSRLTETEKSQESFLLLRAVVAHVYQCVSLQRLTQQMLWNRLQRNQEYRRQIVHCLWRVVSVERLFLRLVCKNFSLLLLLFCCWFLFW